MSVFENDLRTSVGSDQPSFERLISGVRCVFIPTDSQGVTVKIAFDAGSRSELENENGIAHFLEHAVFRGGKVNTSHKAISDAGALIGTSPNAYTSSELVVFYGSTKGNHVIELLDLVTDYVAEPLLREEDIENEKSVIEQEISMYDDRPASAVSKLLQERTYPDHPYGRSTLGSTDSVSFLTRDKLIDFRSRRWTKDSLVVVFAGNLNDFDEDSAGELLSRFSALNEISDRVEPVTDLQPGYWHENRNISQSRMQVSMQLALDLADRKARMAGLFYGMMLSKRLFEEIREEHGLCYGIHANTYFARDIGTLDISTGVAPDNCQEAYDRGIEIIDRFHKEVSSHEDLDRARARFDMNLIELFESRDRLSERALWLDVCRDEKVASIRSELDLSASVTLNDVLDVAHELRLEPAVAIVGPECLFTL